MLPTPVSGCSRVQAPGESEGLDVADGYCSKCMNFNRFLVHLVAIATMECMGIANIQAIAAAGFLAASLFSHTVALRLICLALAVLLALVMVGSDLWQQRARSPLLPPASLAFFLWAVWCGLSLLWSLEPERSEKEFRNEIVYAGLAYWSCFIAGQRSYSNRLPVFILSVALILVCALAIRASFSENPLLGWHGGPGMHSSTLLVVMPCLLGYMFWNKCSESPDFKHQTILSMVVGLCLIAAFSINNRTVWIGFVLQSLLLMTLIRHWHARFSSPGSACTLSRLAWGVLLLLCMFAMFTLQRRDGLQGLAGDIRISLWRESINYVLEAPWFGHGFGRGSVRAALLAEFNDSLLWHSHNLFLEVVLQTGLIGLTLFLLLLGSLVRAAMRYLRHDALAVSMLGMVAGMIVLGMLIRNMTDMLWVRAAALTFWGALGVVFGLACRSSAANTVAAKP